MKKFVRVIPVGALLLAGSSLALNAESVKDEKVLQNYDFTVPKYQANATSADYYRGDYNAKWQASLDKSSEGTGTYMTYWIEAPNNSNLSGAHNIKQGTGVQSYADLNYKGDVHLASQNNNYSAKINYTSGRWDEE